jgi:hypothetical protein
MLQRISADRFETPAGQQVQLILRSSQNNGITSGAFHYAGRPLDGETIQGLPGCSFVPVAGVQQFRVHVDFDPNAQNARYDLFEVDPDNGAQLDLQEHRLASDFDAVIGFGIKGTAALARRAAPKKAARKAAKKRVGKKASIAKAAKKKSPTTKKRAKKKAMKRTTRRAGRPRARKTERRRSR